MKAAYNLLEKGITNLVCIGGDGSLTGANQFRLDWTKILAELVASGTSAVACFCDMMNIFEVMHQISCWLHS